MGLTHGESAVAITLIGLSRPDEPAVSCSLEQLASTSACSIRTAQLSIKKLKELGLKEMVSPTSKNLHRATYDLRKLVVEIDEVQDVI